MLFKIHIRIMRSYLKKIKFVLEYFTSLQKWYHESRVPFHFLYTITKIIYAFTYILFYTSLLIIQHTVENDIVFFFFKKKFIFSF